MSNSTAKSAKSVKSPNEGSKGFLWAVIAIVVIAAVAIAWVVISGQNKNKQIDNVAADETNFSVSYDDDSITLASDDVADSAPVVEMYEDFSCPHCGELAKSDADALLSAVNNGEMTLKVRPMAFMDRGKDDGFSHRSGAALIAAAKTGDADAYWNLRHTVFNNQEMAVGGWDNEQLANAAEAVELPSSAVDEIRDGAYVDEMGTVNDENSKRLEQTPKGVSTPRLFVDGEEIDPSPDWVSQVVNA